MKRRMRLTVLLIVPVLTLVFAVVHALWYAYIRTLNESRLHMIAENVHLVVGVLWGLVAVITGVLTWAIAERLSSRPRSE